MHQTVTARLAIPVSSLCVSPSPREPVPSFNRMVTAQGSLFSDPGNRYGGIPSPLLDWIFLHSPPVTSQRQMLPRSSHS
jgi:hypothetical protein